MGAKILTLIPARAGSRGLRDKNIQTLDGVPLLVRAVRLAQASQRARESWTILVSTDSRRYAALAEEAGARVPFLRPRRLSTSRARLVEVAQHALAELTAGGETFDLVLMLSAATPLTSPRDVRHALALHRRFGQSVISVVDDPVPDAHRFGLAGGRLLAPHGRVVGRRQDGPRRVRLNGAILLATPTSIARHGQFFVPSHTRALVMPRERSIDIEDRLDLEWARWLAGRKQANAKSTPLASVGKENLT